MGNTRRKGGETLESFFCKTKIISGDGALSSLETLNAKRVMVVCDPFFFENGTAQRIAAFCKAQQSDIFHEVAPDPSVELAARGAAQARAFQPDWIVALGGGSAIDCAKAMRRFCGVQAGLAAVPTTSGSGSEVTDFAVLTHNGVKHPLVDDTLRPDVAILDASLVETLPKPLVADGGFDLISHAVESYVAANASAVTDALAQSAFCTALAHLSASYAGALSVRARIHTASTMAGMAFSQAGLGLCHAMAHALGGLFHIPHGRLNAILLPAVIEVNRHSAAEKYARLARAAGLGGSADAVAVRSLINTLVRLRREMELPATLAQAGIAPESVWRSSKSIVEATLADPCCASNPAKVEDFAVRRVLEEVAGRI